MSPDSSNTAEGSSESKRYHRSEKGKDVQKTVTKEELPVSNEDSQALIDPLKGRMNDSWLFETAVHMLKKSVEREVTGDEKTDIALIMKSKVGQIVFGSIAMPTVYWNVAGANQAYPATKFAFDEFATKDFSAVEETVGSFMRNSQILIGILDEVAKIHPFIQVAVSLFKAGLSLKLTHYENEKKVIALNLAMCDMMQVFTILQEIAPFNTAGQGGQTIKNRLEHHMIEVTDLIQLCAKVCNSYQNQHAFVKPFTSFKWKAKFTDVARRFVLLREAIKFDLHLHTSGGVSTANAKLDMISRDVKKLMTMVFERMRSPEECEVRDLVAQHGRVEGPLEDDMLLEQFLAMQKSKDGKGQLRAAKEDKTWSISELRQEVNKDVGQVLQDNEYFDQKLEVVRMEVSEVNMSIRRETDRVVDGTVDGFEGIIDPDIYQVWKEQGWGDSVKAEPLVSELYKHFAKRLSPKDQWALKPVRMLGVQPLVEELDDGVSLPVTVSQMNAFTAARPHTWSLPEWISYWTHGFDMTVQWYLHRIRKVIAEIRRFSNITLSSKLKQLAENALPGLGDIKEWDDFNWEDDYLFYNFMAYVVENEGRMERALRGVSYRLEAVGTLTVVAGEGRLEKYILPLMFLLMRRALWAVKQQGQTTLHESELDVISGSLSTLASAVYDRVLTLQDVYKPQNQDQSSKFFFGLYQIHATTSKMTNPEGPVPPSSGAQNTNPKDRVVLSFGVQNINPKDRVQSSSGAQDANPEDAQNANPEGAQNANPEDKQDTNSEDKQDTNSEDAQDTNSEDAQDTNPEDEQDTNPEDAQNTNPADEQNTNPKDEQDTSPEDPVSDNKVAEDSASPVEVEDSPPDDVELPMDSESPVDAPGLEEASPVAEGGAEVEETGIGSGEL